ncbi:MAG: Crp/Fnr family transcriptional regulator [Cytobacillus gottheilii]|uniref:Crp/Fnr family transcriptional regulator n=1 Tax=Cytobacillus gottheilii TaxID=859144 RepID=UPI0008330BFC|nr:Crp/Fnr family transcriptional regulator [Cytobacillus gottheilii]
MGEFLTQFSVFKQLNATELKKIKEISIIREMNKGSHVFMQGEQLENVYFIKRGRIKIYKCDSSGKEQIVNMLKAGDMFPHVGFFRGGQYPAFAEVIEQAQLVVVPNTKFEKILMTNPELAVKMLKVLGEKIVDLQERLEAQVLDNSNMQLVKLLIMLAKKEGKLIDKETYLLKLKMTNKEIAQMIGTSRETISRTLTKMKKENIILEHSTGGIIIEPDRLLAAMDKF